MASLIAQKRLDDLAAHLRAEYRLDASESIHAARELLAVRAQAFETVFPEYDAMSKVPVKTDVSEFDTHYTYQVETAVGTTSPMTGKSKNAPRAEVSMVEATPIPFVSFSNSWGVDFMELGAAAKTGRPLAQKRMSASRRAVAHELNRILTYGDTTTYGPTLYGIANLTGTLAFTPANSAAAGTPAWANKTPEEILADLNGIATGIVVNSNGVEVPNVIRMGLASYEIIATRRMGDGSDTTILKFFLATNPHIKKVESWFALDAASDPASLFVGNRMMCLREASDVLEAIVPVTFNQLPPKVEPKETTTECYARTCGVVLYKPKAVSYGDNI